MAPPRVALILAASLLWWSPSLYGQDGFGPVQYSARQLDCARFLETSESKILTQSGRRDREQTAGRSGVWRFRAAPDSPDVTLEGWLDSLVLWRRSPETTVRPDTDGLLGGRYRGTLSRNGAYLSRARPFVPDEVAEIAGMATALDDFFPPLPRRQLRAGEVWSDSGVTIRRMSDSALSGLPLYRFALEATRETRSATMAHDSLPLRLHQVSLERGTFVWHPILGLVRRERHIVIETTVPPSHSVRQAIRSRVDQRISVRRDLGVPPAGCS